MDSSDIRHYRLPEDGRAHVVEPGGRDSRGRDAGRSSRLEHFLRHPPLWRSADFFARASMRELVSAVERPGIDGEFSD